MFSIDKHSYIPMYIQIQNELIQKINNKELLPGSRVPSTREITRTTGISYPTVTKAISELVKKGVLVSQIGKGCYAADITTETKEKKNAIGITGSSEEAFFKDSYYSSVFNGMNELFFKERKTLSFQQKEDKRYSELFNQNQTIDGMIVMVPREECFDELRELKIPYIAVGITPEKVEDPGCPSLGYARGEDINYVDSDNSKDTAKVVEHLIKLGHKNIAFLGTTLNFLTTKRRFEGYKIAHKKWSIPIQDQLIRKEEIIGEKPGYQAMLDILDKSTLTGTGKPSGVIVSNLLLTENVIQAILEKGLNIPNDIVIIGYDDFEGIVLKYGFPCGAIKQPYELIGSTAVQELTNLIDGSRAGLVRVNLESEFITSK